MRIVDPRNNRCTETKNLVIALVSNRVYSSFHSSGSVVYDIDKIVKLHILGKKNELESMCYGNAMKVANKVIEATIDLDRKSIKITNSEGKAVQFDSPSRLYLAGLIYSMVIEIIEAASEVTATLNKKRVTAEHVNQAIEIDAELRAAFGK